MTHRNIKHFVHLFLFAFTFLLDCGSMTMPAPTSKPSGIDVQGMFKDSSPEDLAAQVQQGQDLINYMETQATPEERAAFEAEMMKMLESFTEADWAEIQKIAEFVEPYIETPNIETPKTRPEQKAVDAKKAEPKKDAPKVTADDSIRSLLLTINNIIDTITLKIASDPLLSDHFASEGIKSSIALFQRLISLLSGKQNITRLSDKNNKNNEKLLLDLKNFKNKLELKNKDFKVEDSFGLKAKNNKSEHANSRKSYSANIKQLDAIIEEFNKGLDELMPEMEKFIRLHEKDDQEMAKLYKELKAASQKHAKDAQKKRGSSPAKSTPNNSNNRSQNNQPGQNFGNSYDPAANNSNSANQPTQNNKDKKNNPAPANNQPGQPYKTDKDKKDDHSPYEQITSELDEYILGFDSEDVEYATATFNNIKADFNAPNNSYSPLNFPTPTTVADAQKQIKDYNGAMADFVQKESTRLSNCANKLQRVEIDFKNLSDAMNNSQKLVRNLNAQEVDNLLKYDSYNEILNRSDKYEAMLPSVIESQKTFSLKNIQNMNSDLQKIQICINFLNIQTPSQLTQPDQDLYDLAKNSTLALQNDVYQKERENYNNLQNNFLSKDIFVRTVKSAKRKFERAPQDQKTASQKK